MGEPSWFSVAEGQELELDDLEWVQKTLDSVNIVHTIFGVQGIRTKEDAVTREEAIQKLSNVEDSELYTPLRVAGVQCYHLTDKGAVLAEEHGFEIDADAYGCDYPDLPEADADVS